MTIVHACLVDVVMKPRQRQSRSSVPQHGIAAADHDRDISDADVKLTSNSCVAITVEIDVVETAGRFGSGTRAHSVLMQRRADRRRRPSWAINSRRRRMNAHESAQFRVGLDQSWQLIAIELISCRARRRSATDRRPRSRLHPENCPA